MMLGLLAVGGVTLAATSATDFSGIWQLDEAHSDSALAITARLHAERRREQTVLAQPAAAASSGTPSSSAPSGRHGGGGRGMGGGGGGHHGGQNQDTGSDTNNAPSKDPTPPLLENDSLLNVQQDAKSMMVMLNDIDRLDTKFDGVARQSLNGSAVVQTESTSEGMQISMQFKDGTTLQQNWVRSADGHQLTVTETWTTTVVKEPIIFQRSYTRLDI
jgi:hypothetical protein